MIFSMFICGKIIQLHPRYRGICICISILVFTILSGLRYDVGVDYLTYKEIFESFTLEHYNISIALSENARYEFGFITLVRLCSILGMSPQMIFALFAFIQISCIYYVFKEDSHILPYIGLTLIAGGEYFMWMNAIRQITSVALFLVASKLLFQKKNLGALIVSAFACLMHKSAILFVPILFFSRFFRSKIPSTKLQLVCFCVSILISNLQIWTYFSNVIMSILSFMGDFGDRYSSDSILEVNSNLDFGLRMAITLMMNFICIIYSKSVSKTNNSTFNYCYNVFFIGMILSQIFSDNHYLTRFALYFSSLTFIVYSYILAYLHCSKKVIPQVVKVCMLIFLFLYLFRTLQADNGTASILYKFYFQN